VLVPADVGIKPRRLGQLVAFGYMAPVDGPVELRRVALAAAVARRDEQTTAPAKPAQRAALVVKQPPASRQRAG
jgi:hypothetical protein